MSKSTQTLEQQFITPSDEFTPIPFWFWNDDLTREELLRQIADFAEKGVMGFVIHPRIGIPETIPYLSDVYMDLVEAAVAEAAQRGMTVILYDEAMYPSGSAQGRVVKGNPEYASRGLRMAELPCGEPVALSGLLEQGEMLVSAQAVKKQDGRVADPAATVVLKAEDGQIRFVPQDGSEWTILLFIETFSRGTIRGIHFGEDDGEPNAPAAADLLNPEATRKFIRLTHDRYYERLAPYFGSTIIAMFTDEPDMLGRRHRKGLQPWTTDFLDVFLAQGNQESDLPLLWLQSDKSEAVRRRFRQTLQKQMVATYYKPLSDWCAEHGIALTGHPAGSDDIGLLEHFQIPGQDVVWRWVAPEDNKALEGKHSTAGKCSSDAARHRGRRRNLNEVLGVCGRGNGWHLTGDDMKWYLDWLLVRGVNMLCPHAFYYSVEGPRRFNERPPDVGANNIWWPHYKQFSDYMKRMSWIMTDSRNVTPVAVLCRGDEMPWKMVKPLYESQIEFNYLEENLLPECRIDEGLIRIAEQSYSVLLVEGSAGWNADTLAALRRFQESGGAILCWDEADTLSGTTSIKSLEQLVPEIDRLVDRDVHLDPLSPDIRVSHVVKEGQHVYVLVNEGERRFEGRVRLGVTGAIAAWDAWEGDISAAAVVQTDAHGVSIPTVLERRQSLIYRVDAAGKPAAAVEASASGQQRSIGLTDGWRIEAPGLPAAPEGLGSWTATPGLESSSGTVYYLNTFSLDSVPEAASIRLELGEVHELAEVWVNGQAAGVAMWAPYTIDIRPYANAGVNELKVAVTNSLAGRYDGAVLPSGLIGPVRVVVTQ